MANDLSRRIFLSGISAGAVVGFSACDQEKIERIAPTDVSTSPSTGEAESGSDPRKWVHIGDSFTAISSVVKDLSNLTGYEHINAGVSGDTSINAALRTGAVESQVSLEGNLIKESERSLVTDFSPVNFIAQNSWKYAVKYSGVDGYLINIASSGITYFERKLPGDAIGAEPLSDLLVDPDGEMDFLRKGPKNKYSMIIGLGRNDIDLSMRLDDLIGNINKIINLNSEENSRYLIWEIPPWADEPFNSESRQKVDEWNDALSNEFGQSFVRPIKSMMENSDLTFDKAGVIPTAQDLANIENGIIPATFRKDTRGHLNDIGSRPWAYFMYQEMKKRGW